MPLSALFNRLLVACVVALGLCAGYLASGIAVATPEAPPSEATMPEVVASPPLVSPTVQLDKDALERQPCLKAYGKAQAVALLPAWQQWLISPYGWYVRNTANRCMATASPLLMNRLRQYPVPSPTPWIH